MFRNHRDVRERGCELRILWTAGMRTRVCARAGVRSGRGFLNERIFIELLAHEPHDPLSTPYMIAQKIGDAFQVGIAARDLISKEQPISA
jgi:hypothetical protein